MGYGQQKILPIGFKPVVTIEGQSFLIVDPNPAHQLIHPKFDPLRIVN